MRSNLISFVLMFFLALTAVSAFTLDVDVVTGEENATINFTANEAIDSVWGEIVFPDGSTYDVNTTEIFLSGLEEDGYMINVTANNSLGNESELVDYFKIDRLAVLSESSNDEDSFFYEYSNDTVIDFFEVSILNSTSVIETKPHMESSFENLMPGDYTLRVNLTSALGTEQVYDESINLPEFYANVTRIKFNEDEVTFVVNNNYECANSTLTVYYSNGSVFDSESLDKCDEYVWNLPISDDYTLDFKATSRVYGTERNQVNAAFALYPSEIEERTVDNLTARINRGYTSMVLYPKLRIAFYEEGSLIKSAENAMGAILPSIDKEKEYVVEILIATSSGIIIEEVLISEGEDPVTPPVVTPNNNNNGGGRGGRAEVCTEWSICLNGTQTQSCDNGRVTKTRDCADENGTIILDDNVNVPAETNQTEGGFFSPITGAVVGVFTGENSQYWIAGLIILLLIALWIVILRKTAPDAKGKEKVTPVKEAKKKPVAKKVDKQKQIKEALDEEI